ncbi:MAG: membrane protein insertion efficiency factor YidD [Sphingobacterium sp.]|nr:membrane protein insertion efficiency factor YidD [Sphingobacterium sp.]
MRYLLLAVIKVYWLIIPRDRRCKCIFRHSCSKFVFDVTRREGFMAGSRVLLFRMRNCNGHFDIITDHGSGERKMYLKGGAVVGETDIAERLL